MITDLVRNEITLVAGGDLASIGENTWSAFTDFTTVFLSTAWATSLLIKTRVAGQRGYGLKNHITKVSVATGGIVGAVFGGVSYFAHSCEDSSASTKK